MKKNTLLYAINFLSVLVVSVGVSTGPLMGTFGFHYGG
ncbi:Putative membrane protein [Paenibacillus macerans]